MYDKFQELGVKLYNIVGNHDAYYKNTNDVNSVDCLLSEYKNVIRVSEPKEYKIGGASMLLVPWICEDNEQQTFNAIKKSKAKIAMGHLELNGFEAYRGHTMDKGLDPSAFKKFNLVYSGHYHTRSNDGKIFYLGNPYQMFWNDVDDKEGFISLILKLTNWSSLRTLTRCLKGSIMRTTIIEPLIHHSIKIRWSK